MYRWIKRGLDFFLALLMGVVFLPFGLIIALLIKLTSPGPAIFRQERVGKNLRIFRIFKFRTMRVETETDGVPLSDKQRMTAIGRFLRKLSLDEMPQMLNILRGEMSFIGPRPLLKQYIPLYTPEQNRRHEVLPGISGWAQVNGRNAITWEEKFALDIWYVDHIGFALDAKIVARTALGVLRRDGIEASETETMPPFMGSVKNREAR